MLLQKKILELEKYTEKVEQLKSEIDFSKTSFEIWRKFANKDQYKFMLGINTPIGEFIEKYCSWIRKERYRVLDLELILDFIKELKERNEITESELETLRNYLQKINFDSMIIDY